ncbi:MAG: oxidoreductase [Acidobacteria bacterium]|nr:oxidoreductase [Acidobacteriota bacterium]
MGRYVCPVAAVMFLLGLAVTSATRGGTMTEVRFMTLDPGHFHAGLVQKEMYPNVARRVHVYAPLGADLTEHLNRIVAFNSRRDSPTAWELEVHAGPDSLQRMLREKPGNVVVLSGRNRGKIDKIKASVEAGLNVLSDKPWIIDPADFPKLESALATAERRGLIAYDIMTERYEITTMLQRELINDKSIFGTMLPGSLAEPSVYMESVHHLFKMVAGMVNRRPAWFFDVEQQGESVPDVGTHLVDLVQWMLYPDASIDYRKDVQVLAAKRWPTVMSREEFQKVTGEPDFPAYLQAHVHDGKLDYYCNGQVSYALRGVHVKLDVLWRYEAPPGTGDTHFAYFKGSRSRVEIRQGKEENYRPELYVVPNDASDRAALAPLLAKKMEQMRKEFPGVSLSDHGGDFRIDIPDKHRVGHEAHFAQVTHKFLQYLKDARAMPAWERPNMLAKYWVTTQALKLGRRQGNDR